MSTGAISHTLKEGRAGSDLLRALARTERVSLRWLDEGRGAPYVVARMTSDSEATAYLDELFAEDWRVVVATADDATFAIILEQPGSYQLKDKTVEYRIVEVLAGNISIETVRWLTQRDRGLWLLRLTPDDMRRLSDGQMGNIELFGFHDPRKSSRGLIERAQSTVHDSAYMALFNPPQEVREPHGMPAHLSYDEAILVQKYRQLAPENKSHAQALLVRLLTREVARRG